jgi:hypothetical protein
MRISDEALGEFIAIYKDEFGETLDRKEATEMGQRVLALYELLAHNLQNGEQPASVTTGPTADPPSIGYRT